LNSVADTLQQVNDELLQRLRFFALDPQCVLDLGAGTCLVSLTLRQRFPRAQVIALDRSHTMLKAAPRSLWPRSRFHRAVGNGSALPLRDRSVDLAYSCLMLPSCEQPVPVFRELARVLKPGGLFVFSTTGPGTSPGWRAALEQWAQGVEEPPTVPQLGDALLQSGLTEPVMDVEHYAGLHGQGGAPAMLEVIFGAAFGAGAATVHHTKAPAAGEFAVPLERIGRPRGGER
jgi:malonyl-CoA O-methyltransferase